MSGYSKLDQHTIRNISHTALYLICCLGVVIISQQWILITTTALSIGFTIIGVETKLFKNIMIGSRYRDYGIVSSGLGFLALILCFFHQPQIMICALAIVGIADPSASWIGRNFGKKQIILWKNKKTVEGSMAFLLATFCILIVFLLSNGTVSVVLLATMFIFAVFLSGIELVSPSFSDNFLIQVLGATGLSVITQWMM